VLKLETALPIRNEHESQTFECQEFRRVIVAEKFCKILCNFLGLVATRCDLKGSEPSLFSLLESRITSEVKVMVTLNVKVTQLVRVGIKPPLVHFSRCTEYCSLSLGGRAFQRQCGPVLCLKITVYFDSAYVCMYVYISHNFLVLYVQYQKLFTLHSTCTLHTRPPPTQTM
jgi:hypothetical protein